VCVSESASECVVGRTLDLVASPFVMLEVAGREVRLSNPDKVYFPALGITKRDLVDYYVGLGDLTMSGIRLRPMNLKRYPDGIDAEPFFQKRVPDKRPDWLSTATVSFPSGRTAEELCPTDVAHVAWAVNLGCIELHPWPVRRFDLDHPDELRIDLDPQPDVTWDEVRTVAGAVRDVLDEHGLVGWPKTSGNRGIHVLVRIVANQGFTEVRRAVLALGREVERRLPDLATTTWSKEDRGRRVLIDYNQNARDRTTAAAWSVRPNPQAMVSMPFAWDDLGTVTLEAFTLRTVPDWVAAHGDPHAGIEDTAGNLRSLLQLAAADAP